MSEISYPDFQHVYRQAYEAIYAHWTPEMQSKLARHCRPWSPDVFSFQEYLEKSAKRFYIAYQELARDSSARRVCDVGGFWGVFPMTLAALGYDVTMTEALEYYNDTFDALFHTVAQSGVSVVDCDLFQDNVRLPGEFDFVTVMAVLEHYPHSLRTFMQNCTALMEPCGRIYIEVPNIAYWHKRIRLLRGSSPLVPVGDIYESATPFIGHHHEFTMQELYDLARRSGLSVTASHCYNYSRPQAGFNNCLRHPVEMLAFTLAPQSRELISVLCERRAA